MAEQSRLSFTYERRIKEMAKRRGNNEGSVFQRSNGTWRAQVYLNGKRLSYTGKSQKECQAWIRNTRDKVDRGLTFEGSKMTLAQFLDEWVVSISSSRSNKTVEQYSWVIEKRILPFIGDVKLKDLGPDRVQHFYHHLLSQERLSNHAVNHTHRVLRTSLNQAVKLGLIIKNPCSATTPPKPEKHEMQFLDEYQVQIFLNSARKMQSRFYAYFFLAIHTGMRTGELLGLKWRDINWDKKSLLVQRQVQHPKGGGYIFTKLKSKSSQRSIALGDQAIEVLKQQRSSIIKLEKVKDKDWDDLDLVFPSSVGTPLMRKRLRDNFYLVLEEAGLPRIRLHDLRHTAASLLLNHGVPVLIVSKRLGHSKPSITMDVYGHVIPTIQEGAAHLMDELMSPIEITNCTIFAPRVNKKP